MSHAISLTPSKTLPAALLAAVLSTFLGPMPLDAAALQRGEPFSATAQTLLGAAEETPDGHEGRILLRHVEISFDGEGRRTYRRWQITHLASEAAVEAAVPLAVEWVAWYQERPEARLRLVTPEGEEHYFAAPEAGRREFGARAAQYRALEIPIPQAVPGSVIEEEIVVRDHRPFFAAGMAAEEPVAMPYAVDHTRLVFEAPTALPLRVAAEALPGVEPARTVVGEKERWVFELEEVPPRGKVEPGTPAFEARWPQIGYSTGASWREVATAHAHRVDERLAEAGLGSALGAGEARTEAAESDAERIAAELEKLRRDIRPAEAPVWPSGFGPGPLREALERGAGDAEEMAVLLVGRLRAVGIPAFVALVKAGFGEDLEANLPGLGPFNHALVHVPARRPIWIDPSDLFARVGELPVEVQGRLVLVASPQTDELLRLPASESFDNRVVTTVEVRIAEEGPGTFLETTTFSGSPERTQRRLMAGAPEEGIEEALGEYVGTVYRADELGRFDLANTEDLSKPFELEVEALGAGRARTEGDEAAVAIPLQGLVGLFPSAVLAPPEVPREHDFIFHEPFLVDWRYRLHPPEGFEPRDLPEGGLRELSTAKLESTFAIEDGVVEASFRLDSGPRLITAEQFEKLRREVQEFLAEETLVLFFERGRAGPA